MNPFHAWGLVVPCLLCLAFSPAVPDRQLASQARLALEANDASNAVAQATALVEQQAGRQVSRTGDMASATTLRFQLPAAALPAILPRLESLGTLTSRYIENEDVTAPGIDLEARLKCNTGLRDRLRQLLNRTTAVPDTLAVESELNRVQGEIDAETAALAALRNRTETAALEVTLRPAPPRRILGPLGFVFHSLAWTVEKLFVIRDGSPTPVIPPVCLPPPLPPPPVPVFPESAPADSELLIYTVQEGDTVVEIGRLFVVSPEALRRVNPQLGLREASPGEVIRIPPAEF